MRFHAAQAIALPVIEPQLREIRSQVRAQRLQDPSHRGMKRLARRDDPSHGMLGGKPRVRTPSLADVTIALQHEAGGSGLGDALQSAFDENALPVRSRIP